MLPILGFHNSLGFTLNSLFCLLYFTHPIHPLPYSFGLTSKILYIQNHALLLPQQTPYQYRSQHLSSGSPHWLSNCFIGIYILSNLFSTWEQEWVSKSENQFMSSHYVYVLQSLFTKFRRKSMTSSILWFQGMLDLLPLYIWHFSHTGLMFQDMPSLFLLLGLHKESFLWWLLLML